MYLMKNFYPECKELSKLSKEKKNPIFQNGQKICTNTLPEKIHGSQISTVHDVQLH